MPDKLPPTNLPPFQYPHEMKVPFELPTQMVDTSAVSRTPGFVQRVEDHPLYPVLLAAIQQAMGGKGKRHGGATVPFLEQPWKHYAKMHGRGFLTGQASKKLEEAASTRTGEAFEVEVLGAIVYCGMALINEREARNGNN